MREYAGMQENKNKSKDSKIYMENFHQMLVQVKNISHITRHGLDLLCVGKNGIDPIVIIDDSKIVQMFRNSGIKNGDMIVLKCTMHNHKFDGYFFRVCEFEKVEKRRNFYRF